MLCCSTRQDCCLRDPFWGYNDRYSGVIDGNLTQEVCVQDQITLDTTSPCLNVSLLETNSIAGSKELTTMLIVFVLIAMCLFVVDIMVPLAVFLCPARVLRNVACTHLVGAMHLHGDGEL